MTSKKTNRLQAAVAASALLAVLAGAALYFSPYWTLHTMRTAIAARDVAAFSLQVDYPELTENLKGQLMRQMSDTMGAAGKNDRLSGLGQMLAVGLLGQMVDSFVSPVSVMRMVAEGRATVDVDELVAPRPAGAGATPRFALRYRDTATALLRADDASAIGAFVFTRQGLWAWKLTGVELPR